MTTTLEYSDFLIEIQECNRDFLYELNLAKRTSYCSHLIEAFKIIEIIEVLHRRIFSIIGDDLYHEVSWGFYVQINILHISY